MTGRGFRLERRLPTHCCRSALALSFRSSTCQRTFAERAEAAADSHERTSSKLCCRHDLGGRSFALSDIVPMVYESVFGIPCDGYQSMDGSCGPRHRQA